MEPKFELQRITANFLDGDDLNEQRTSGPSPRVADVAQ